MLCVFYPFLCFIIFYIVFFFSKRFYLKLICLFDVFYIYLIRIDLPNPRDYPASNDLDNFIYDQRFKLLSKATEEAKQLRETCNDVTMALNFVTEFQENLKSLAFEVRRIVTNSI